MPLRLKVGMLLGVEFWTPIGAAKLWNYWSR